jgi:NAD(P)-dependent dehydrogenase (short-subunit alcohol dehydrogenase family)
VASLALQRPHTTTRAIERADDALDDAGYALEEVEVPRLADVLECDKGAADRTAIQLEPAFVAALESHQPIRRAGTPEDVAQVMLWLASDASSFVNGQRIQLTVQDGPPRGQPSRAGRRRMATPSTVAGLHGWSA